MNYKIVIFFCLISFQLFSQQDSITVSSSDQKKSNSFTSIFYGQPGKAALYSLIIPGAGQLYNKRYWKAPIVWAGEGFAIYYLASSINTFQNRNDCWKGLLQDSTDPNLLCTPTNLKIPISLGNITDVSNAFDLRNSARSQKERAWLIMSAVHLMNIVEAFVDRHLINFDTSEDLSFHNMPNVNISESSQLGIAKVNLISLRFGLN